jgi:hypothetical protein
MRVLGVPDVEIGAVRSLGVLVTPLAVVPGGALTAAAQFAYAPAQDCRQFAAICVIEPASLLRAGPSRPGLASALAKALLSYCQLWPGAECQRPVAHALVAGFVVSPGSTAMQTLRVLYGAGVVSVSSTTWGALQRAATAASLALSPALYPSPTGRAARSCRSQAS